MVKSLYQKFVQTVLKSGELDAEEKVAVLQQWEEDDLKEKAEPVQADEPAPRPPFQPRKLKPASLTVNKRSYFTGTSSNAMSNKMISKWMSIPQAAKYLQISEDQIQSLIEQNKITTYGLNNFPAVHVVQVESALRGVTIEVSTRAFDEWINISAAVELVGVEHSVLTEDARSGDIASHRIGQYLFVHLGEIERRYLKEE